MRSSRDMDKGIEKHNGFCYVLIAIYGPWKYEGSLIMYSIAVPYSASGFQGE